MHINTVTTGIAPPGQVTSHCRHSRLARRLLDSAGAGGRCDVTRGRRRSALRGAGGRVRDAHAGGMGRGFEDHRAADISKLNPRLKLSHSLWMICLLLLAVGHRSLVLSPGHSWSAPADRGRPRYLDYRQGAGWHLTSAPLGGGAESAPLLVFLK